MINRFLKNIKMSEVKRIRKLLFWIPAIPVAIAFLLLILGAALVGEAVYLFVLPLMVLYFLLRIGSNRVPTVELILLETRLEELASDRAYFVPNTEVRIRTAWEEELRTRCEGLGLESNAVFEDSADAPLYFGYRSDGRFVLVYSVPTLDSEVYARLSRDAALRCAGMGVGDPETSAAVWVVLADTVTPDARDKAKEDPEIIKSASACAFVDCGANRVYMDGARYDSNYHRGELAMQKMLGALVFGTNGSIPRNADAPTEEYSELFRKLDSQTYGEYADERERLIKEAKEKQMKIAEALTEGGFCLSEGCLFHMVGGRMMGMQFYAEDGRDEEDPIGDVPGVPGREIVYFEFDLSWQVPNRAMGKKDRVQYLPEMIAYMESLGYRVVRDAK